MKRLFSLVLALIMACSVLMPFGVAYAEGSTFISVSPMRESVVLNPGDVYKGSFVVSNPGFSEKDLNYHVDIKPFYVDENYQPVFDEREDSDKQLIKDWIEIIKGQSGTVSPNDSVVVEYEITVPENAPAGGQYACLSATTDIPSEGNGAINIGEGMAINYVVLAEITGSTVVSGGILDAGIQGFLLGGDIRAYSMIENTGNVHGLATYTMKVRSVFTGEEIYNNEEDVDSHYVLPDRRFFNETYFEGTPIMGVFDVSYVVDFQGQKSELNRVVVVCPWWLLLIIILGLVVLTFRVMSLAKLRKISKAMEKEKKEKEKSLNKG